MTNFVHLHSHSCYSFLDGYGLPHQIIDRISELKQDACAVTDHGNCFVHHPWAKACSSAGKKALYGLEAYICDDHTYRPPKRKRGEPKLTGNETRHITLIAQSDEGYRNLLRLNRIAWMEGHYYKPRIDRELLARHQQGLVVLSGCVGGYPSQLCFHQGPEAMVDWLIWMRDRIEQFYIEYNPIPELDLSYRTLGLLTRAAQEFNIPAVLTADAHFPRPGDYEVQDTLLAVGTRCLKDSDGRTMKLPEYLYYCSPEELIQRARKTAIGVDHRIWDRAAAVTGEIAERCQVELPRAEPVAFWNLGGQTASARLRNEVEAGFLRRFGDEYLTRDNYPDDYEQRAWSEYGVLVNKGFADYLLAIQDVVRHIRAQGGVVICRGSAGGCLLLWLLGVSETDPIRHGLSFERFYDETRPDPPDVDLDFSTARRDEAIAYVREKYGEDRVSQIAALSQIKGRAAVLDVSFALGIPRRDILPLSAAVDSAGGEMALQLQAITDPAARAILDAHPDLARLIPQVVGQYRQHSIHAAGVLVASQPLDEVIPVVRGNGGQTVAALDKRDAAAAGFLKMDFLSVRALDILETCLVNTGMTFEQLVALPLDDQEALEQARQGDLAGIFQLEGGSAGPVCRTIGIDTFEDLVAASALCRPGPKEWVDLYATRKHQGDLLWELEDPTGLLGEILRPTYGILLYQEQVMRLCHEVAGMEWPDVHKLRKGVGDKDPAAFARLHTTFIGGCVRGGLSYGAAEHWWEAIETHAGYSFNRSHCTTYGLIAYWFLWFKAHHPDEFYHAHLQHESDALTIKRLIREFMARGGEVTLLDPARSMVRFSLHESERRLIGGVLYLHGVGKVSAEKIVARRKLDDPANWAHFSQQFPARPREAIRAAHLDRVDPEEWDIQRMILLAPWFPVPAMMEGHRAMRDSQPFDRIESALSMPTATLCGYVTALKVTTDRVLFTLEDETGSALVRVSRKQVAELHPFFAKLAVADFVILPRVKHWRGTLFIERVERHAPIYIWAPAPATRSMGEGDALKAPPILEEVVD